MTEQGSPSGCDAAPRDSAVARIPCAAASDPDAHTRLVQLLLEMGAGLTHALTQVKHNGSIERASLVLTAVCSRHDPVWRPLLARVSGLTRHTSLQTMQQLRPPVVEMRRCLATGSMELERAPSAWLASLLSFLCRPGQGLSDIVRRSAGLPAGILSIFRATSYGTRREVCGFVGVV